jgi:microcystin-dependent protein
MLDTSTDLHGILLDDYTYINGNLNVLNKVSIGNVDPTSHLTVAGNASIGDGYKAIQAPTDGAIIEGKVGLGISAPTAKLHINNSTTENSFLVEDDTNLDSTPFVINNAGEVGIGVTSPTAKVHINNSTALNSFLVEDSTAPDSTPFVIDADGNVGVRIGTPLAPLHVQSITSTGGNVPDGLSLILQRYNTLGQSMNFFQNGSGNQILSYSSPINAKSIVMHATTDASNTPVDLAQSADIALIFKIKGNEIVRITANQRVGIGTTTPDEKLHVEGHIKMVDGNQQAAAVMTSDANGVGSWTPFSAVGVPLGSVMPYFGSAAPAGWLKCDGNQIPAGTQYDALRAHCISILGQAVTPDIRERFVVGAGDNATAGGPYYVANTGGVNENYLRQEQIPAHSHEMRNDETSPGAMNGPNGATVNITGGGSHNHRARTHDNLGRETEGIQTAEGAENPSWSNYDRIAGGDHTHTNADFAGHTGNGKKNAAGDPQLTWGTVNGVASATTPVNNLPPYYALTYIIKY